MNSNAAKLFRQFAEERFNTHFNELNTKYQNQSVERTTMKKAFDDHRKIFQNELDQKIQSLIPGGENRWLEGELGNLKQMYMAKLELNRS